MQFDDFAGITQEEWKQLILKTIKAETQEEKLHFYAQKLIQHPEPGIEIQPFYMKEDLAGLEYLQGFHQLWAQSRQTTGWINVENIAVYDEATANQQAKDALTKGTTGIRFNLLNRPGGKPMLTGGMTTEHLFDFSVLLEGISLSRIPVYFHLRHTQLENLSNYLQEVEKDISTLMGGIIFEEIALSAILPDEFTNEALLKSLQVSSLFTTHTPYFKLLLIEPVGEPLDDNAEMETFALPVVSLISYQLQAIVKLIDDLETILPITDILPKVGFIVDIGDYYFMEIAKLRALRLIWWQIGRTYHPESNLIDVFIYAQTAILVPPADEPYQSLLTNTTQAMSAIIGGCDALAVQPAAFTNPQDSILGKQIARNVSAILQEESYFDKVTDIGAGSYLIENLTHQIAQSIWEKLST
ncbi:methylmalonyl-CoA mutase family protein [Cytophagaceae bacterium DM2B3-1]|uniref:Methylmalonyl-CoA mutase family protein n=1 Tax=Xanthocytophaga flava TaxID=3048013 RepID=A0ABT7CFQ3_9BACT|nr:methylmalonyl-CoA mutase family protein [Xanthocytophaga flavus]MDJ1466570.1 methylmalonyl-CoA mutase family protein [Xanthocytophaga flavus]MDJ1492568.1 methylmalonyl-CoA mutase family protein [Xanthocytophaga flavus]